MDRMDFAIWLEEQLHERAWKPADLAHAARINTGTLSNILNGTRGAGPEVCRDIARALRLPEEIVFRRAGLLSQRPEMDDEKREILYHYDRMRPHDQERFSVIARALAGASESDKAAEVEPGAEVDGSLAPV